MRKDHTWGVGLVALTLLGLAVLTILALSGTAHADIKQPDGTTIPSPAIGCYSGKPGGLGAIFACICTQSSVCNIGAPCPGGSTSCDPGKNGTCEATIWHEVNDDPCIPTKRSGLDPVKDAAVKPETFKPTGGACAQKSYTLLTRGGAMFKNAFGWYNVDPGGKKPSASDLHTLIDCSTAAGTTVPLDLSKEPSYKGGEIAFFIATPEDHSKAGACAKGDCCASVTRLAAGEGYAFYSQPQHNPDNTGASSYIHLLIYKSQLTSFKYYFAWEDIFKGSVSNDFGDFVTAVTGISCPGGGQKCDTGQKGVCAAGVTKCISEGKVECVASTKSTAEVCDGLDNNCDGEIDNGATCPDGKKCFQGVCVGSCETSQEFACQLGYECDKQLALCVDTKCKGKLCKPGEICRGGLCGNGCDGVVCPGEQICQTGLCVDLCANHSCATGEVCKWGVCIPGCLSCGGLECAAGLDCNKTTNDCVDPSCGAPCASGTVCKQGKCVDLCDGVVCPGGVACEKGSCPPPGIGKSKPLTDGTQPRLDGGSGDGPGGDGGKGFSSDRGCSCRIASTGAAELAWPMLALLLLALRRRAR